MSFFSQFFEKFKPSKKEGSPSNIEISGFLGELNNPRAQFETTLTNIRKISPDSYIYTYALPNPDLPLGLLPGHHVAIHAPVGPFGISLKRKYTPISSFNQKGTFDLLVKIYRANTHPDFPNGGRLTPYLENLQVGAKVMMSGPTYKKTYLGHGKVIFKGTEYNVKEIGMIAGGTGIAPMYQVIRAVLDDPTDQTKLHLLFANRSEQDILMREELDQAAKDPRIKIHYTIDQASPGWKGYTGFITKEMLQQSMPKPSDDVLLWGCGPKPMKKSVKSYLKDLGYDMGRAML